MSRNAITRGLPTAWRLVAGVDLNGDGIADLLRQNSQTNQVAWWEMAVQNGSPVSVGGGYLASGVSLLLNGAF